MIRTAVSQLPSRPNLQIGRLERQRLLRQPRTFERLPATMTLSRCRRAKVRIKVVFAIGGCKRTEANGEKLPTLRRLLSEYFLRLIVEGAGLPTRYV